MIFQYIDMLSGMPIPLEGVGHVKSPLVKDVTSNGIGSKRYRLYLQVLNWTKIEILEAFEGKTKINIDALISSDKVCVFDLIGALPMVRSIFLEVFSFFMEENVRWSNEGKKFLVTQLNDKQEPITIGEIDNSNFEMVRVAMLEVNFIFSNKSVKPATYVGDKAKELWETAQKKIAKLNAEKPEEAQDSTYELGNIISKLCILQPNYNLFNVYNLTIFQLYDQFIQAKSIKMSDLGNTIFAIHGGEKYDPESWMKPIIKN